MNWRKQITKQITSIMLALALIISSIVLFPTTVRAAGWLDAEVTNLSLGITVFNSVKSGDYIGLTEGDRRQEGGLRTYWHIYQFSMPEDGILDIYIESASSDYFRYPNWQSWSYFDGFVIYSYSNPEQLIWRSMYGENEIEKNFSSSRAMYYGSTEISLKQGEYYFAVRHYETNDTPYYLTLSYTEPTINIISISLNTKSIKLEPEEQYTFKTTILPYNATDKTIVWKSSNTSIASVTDGVVTAHSPGSTIITAKSSDGEISTTCSVTVIDTEAINKLEKAKPQITKVSSGVKKATVSFSSIGISDVKYQVSYRTGSGTWKTKEVSGTSATVGSLKSDKTYSIRIRAYKNIDGKVYYSQWSAIKKVKIK